MSRHIYRDDGIGANVVHEHLGVEGEMATGIRALFDGWRKVHGTIVVPCSNGVSEMKHLLRRIKLRWDRYSIDHRHRIS